MTLTDKFGDFAKNYIAPLLPGAIISSRLRTSWNNSEGVQGFSDRSYLNFVVTTVAASGLVLYSAQVYRNGGRFNPNSWTVETACEGVALKPGQAHCLDNTPYSNFDRVGDEYTTVIAGCDLDTLESLTSDYSIHPNTIPILKLKQACEE